MRFIKTDEPKKVAKYLSGVLTEHLGGSENVFWLVPGGSAISVAVETARCLERQGTDTKKLTISLTDERYGDVGHADSNLRQLENAGFSVGGAKMRPVLAGKNLEEATGSFAAFLTEQIRSADYKIALAGLGADGHTFGILPGSPAIDSPELAINFRGADYQRITATPLLIAKLDEVVVFTTGEAKLEAIENLSKDIPISEQPAQALKAVSTLTIFNDQKGEDR